ncbi:MAG: hypothetical protein ACOCUW_00470, partial [Gemmatimonadota bacterium]
LTDTRPYRPAVDPDRALEKIAADRGGHFDPDAVDALLRLHEAGKLDSLAKMEVAGKWMGRQPAQDGRRAPIGTGTGPAVD